ncbi:MAG: hypothetical protein KDE55_11220 [Novosphingobium sp.]|nr:hypothetical protein [Novosphingobium sp.]
MFVVDDQVTQSKDLGTPQMGTYRELQVGCVIKAAIPALPDGIVGLNPELKWKPRKSFDPRDYLVPSPVTTTRSGIAGRQSRMARGSADVSRRTPAGGGFERRFQQIALVGR